MLPMFFVQRFNPAGALSGQGSVPSTCNFLDMRTLRWTIAYSCHHSPKKIDNTLYFDLEKVLIMMT